MSKIAAIVVCSAALLLFGCGDGHGSNGEAGPA